MKKLLLVISLFIIISITAFPQAILRDDGAGPNALITGTSSTTPGLPPAYWNWYTNGNGQLQRFSGIFRPRPDACDTCTIDSATVHKGWWGRTAFWDSAFRSNFEYSFKINNFSASSGPTFHLFASDTGTPTLTFNVANHGYQFRYQYGGGSQTWTAIRFDSGGDPNTGGKVALTWKKAGTTSFVRQVQNSDVVKMQVRKDANNTIALLINQIVIDSIQDNGAGSHTDLFYAGIMALNGYNSQFSNFSIGQYSFVPPPPPGPDLIVPTVGAPYTVPVTGSIDTNSNVIINFPWTDNTMLSAESLWVVGYNGTTDTVLAAHLENINTSSRTIVSTQKKYKLGTHYYWSSAKDTAASQNYFKSVVYSFRVDTATAVSKSNLVAITYLEYWSASFPNPTIYGQIDWDVITHAIYHQGNPSQTVNPDPLYPEIKYWAAGNGTIASFEIDNGQPRVRQAIDSAHAHGRKVILGLGGTSGTGTNWDWMSANNHMKEFVHGISWYCKSRGFDGVDLDWEYPGNGSVYGVTEISAAYDLIRTLRDTLNSAAAGWSTPGIITWAAQPWSSQWYLHPDSVLKWVNYINIMNYDYADYGTSYNAHHTALYPYNVAGIPTYESNNNVISVQDSLYTTASPRNGWGPISYYPKNRVTVGLGFYGHGRGGNALGGLGGSFGFERFGSCTQGMYNTPATAYRYHYDTVAQSPYLAWTDASAPGCGFAATVHFHTFDDTTSIQVKAAWARNNGYAGVMIFDAPGDNSTFDLQRAVKKAFAGAIAIVPPDTIPPVVSITRIGGVVPFGQMTVQGSVLIEISAQDNTSIDVVSFQVDGNWQILTTQTFPYTYLWNTVGLTPGSHTIQARATDPRGNIGYSAPFTLTVQAVVATRIPSIPQLLTPTQAQSISTTSVNLTIADSSCATTCDVVTTYTYEVRIGSSTGAIFTTDASGNNLVKALSGLANGVTYFWRVGATNTVGTVYSQYRNFSVSAAAIAKTYSSFSKWDPINHWWSSMSQPPGYSVMTKTSLSSLVGVLGTSDTNVVIWNQYGTLDNLGNTIPSTQGLITSPQTISALWTFNAGVSTTNLTTAGNVSALTANIGTLTTTNRFANIVFNTVLPLRWNATTNTLTVDSASTTQPGALGAYSYSVFATGVPTSPDTTHKIRTFEDFIYIGGSHINYNSAIVAGDNAYWIPSMSLFGIGSPTVVSGIAVSVVSMLPAVSDSGRIGLIKIDVDSLASGTQNGTLCKGGMLFAYTGSSGSREIINPIKNGNEFTISVKFGTVNDSMAWYAGFFSENYFQNDYTDPALIQNNAISFEYRKIASGAAGDSVYGCTQAGNSKTRTGLFVPVFNGATWNKLTFRSRGTSVDFYVNGVYKKTITTNLPGTTAAVSRGIGMLGYDNAVIGSGKQVIIDYDEFLNNGVIR